MKNREDITLPEIERGLEELSLKLFKRLNDKGWHSLKSSHEIFGVVSEEYHELASAIRENKIEDELMDIAVAAIFGYVNIKSKKIDW